MNTKPLSSVTLEDAKEIVKAGNIHPEDNKEWTLSPMSWSDKGMIFHAGVMGMYFEDKSIGSECFPIPAACYVKAHLLGYYVPELSEAMEIERLEGMIWLCDYLINPDNDLGVYSCKEIAEKQIEELKTKQE